MTRLFCCYYRGYQSETAALAEELRLRGIPVWHDVQGGFQLGNNVQTEARRVIASPEETFGLLLYASPETLERDFVRRIELDEAVKRKVRDPDYLLFTVARRMGFTELAERSRCQLGEDLSVYHSFGIREADGEGISGIPLRPQLIEVANKILEHRLTRTRDRLDESSVLGLNFCTRDHLPPSEDDDLDVDAAWLFQNGSAAETWPRLIAALRDIKQRVRTTLGLTRLRVRGSKHLTAAFLIGRVFPPPTVREIQVQQGAELWSTLCAPANGEPLKVQMVDGTSGSDHLFLEMTTTEKSVREGVRRYIQKSGVYPFASLRLEPRDGPRRGAVSDNATACAMALQVREAVAKLTAERAGSEIHLFAAIPQGLATLIGHHLNASMPIQLYEFDGFEYKPSCRVMAADVQ